MLLLLSSLLLLRRKDADKEMAPLLGILVSNFFSEVGLERVKLLGIILEIVVMVSIYFSLRSE